MRPHIVLFGAFSADRGGIENSILQLATGLEDRYRFTVLTPMSATFAADLHTHKLPFENIAVVPPFSPSAIRKLARRLRGDLGADLIHTLDPRGATVGCVAGRLAGISVVHWNHISPMDYYGLSGWRRAGYALGEMFLGWTMLDAGIFVSESVRQRYIKQRLLPAHRAFYTPNSLDSAAVEVLRQPGAVLRRQYDISPEEFLWVNLGRLTPQKGQEILLQAAAKLTSQTGWRLLIAGDGGLRGVLEQQIETLGLADHVILLGSVSRGEAWRLLGAADGFVLPSRYENMPISILEALTAGLPQIVTDVGDSWRVVGGGDLPPAGLCVPVENVDALSLAMQKLMDSPQLCAEFKAACVARAEQFSPSRTLEAIAMIYARLLGSQEAEN